MHRDPIRERAQGLSILSLARRSWRVRGTTDDAAVERTRRGRGFDLLVAGSSSLADLGAIDVAISAGSLRPVERAARPVLVTGI
jgi:hypothetical protein